MPESIYKLRKSLIKCEKKLLSDIITKLNYYYRRLRCNFIVLIDHIIHVIVNSSATFFGNFLKSFFTFFLVFFVHIL